MINRKTISLRRAFTHIVLVLSFIQMYGQEVSLYQSYIPLPESHNPAYYGSHACSRLALLNKHQWLGIEKAPNQQGLCININETRGKLRKNGYGLLAENDANGPNRATGLSLAFAHHVMVKKAKGNWLSLALSAGVFNKRIDAGDFIANNPIDPLIARGNTAFFKFNASFGALYYTRSLSAGMAFHQLIPQVSTFDKSYRTRPVLVIHSDYIFLIDPENKIVPGFRFLGEYLQHSSADANIRYLRGNMYWLGISARTYFGHFPLPAREILLYFGFRLGPILFTYAANAGFSTLQKNNFGSHELSISIPFCKKKNSCTD